MKRILSTIAVLAASMFSFASCDEIGKVTQEMKG